FLRDAQFLRVLTARRIKLAVPGPFTLAALAQDEHYRDPERLAMAYARAVNEELRELEPVLDWIQLDEPYLEARADPAKPYAPPESADVVAARLREALRHVPAERLVAAPDCGMKYLERSDARARLRALVEGARRV